MTGEGAAGPGAVRVQKYLSQAGPWSRREAERLVEAGRVSVNDHVVDRQGVKVVPGVDRVALDGAEVLPAEARWIVFHKPPGALSTRRDPHGGRTIYDVLPDWAEGLHYVGRLDRETSGLMLLTNDGDLGAALAHPRGRIEREYHVTAPGAVTAKTLRALKEGVELEDGWARPKRVRRIESGPESTTISLVLTEGRKREVRRLMAEVGFPSVSLTRMAFGPFRLGGLPVGAWRPARERELEESRRLVAHRSGGRRAPRTKRR